MIPFEEDRKSQAKWLIIPVIIILLAFTIMDVAGVLALVSDILKIVAIALCLVFSIYLIIAIEPDQDRIMTAFSFAFIIGAACCQIFGKELFISLILLCLALECNLIRIMAMKRIIVRMDGRIASEYRVYRVVNKVMLINFLQVLCAAVPVVISRFIKFDHTEICAAAVFFFVGFIASLINLGVVQSDLRLLDDMKPIRGYFYGMVLCFIGSIMAIALQLIDCFGLFSEFSEILTIIGIVAWPIILLGLICIALSGIRYAQFYT